MNNEMMYSRLSAVVENHRHVVLVTLEADGRLSTCRISSPFADESGTLWLFVDTNAPQVNHVERNPEVCIYCGDADDYAALSVSGTAFVVTNIALQQKVRSIHRNAHETRSGSNSMILIKVTVDYLEYWDVDSKKQIRYSKQKFMNEVALPHVERQRYGL